MNRKLIAHSSKQAQIYKDYYRPSVNPFRFIKSILGIFLFGSSPVVQYHTPGKRKMLR